MHKSHYIIPIFVPHKGCPHNCVFCDQKKITGQAVEVDAGFVKLEIEKYLKTIPGQNRFVEVSFFGGSFTGLPIDEQAELLAPASEALHEKRIDAIRLSTRPDYIDHAILDQLKSYGVSIIELGVQSMDDEVLELSNRGHSSSDVYDASNMIKEYGFTLGLQMMVGLPGDTMEKDLYTADEFVKIKPSMVRIYPALVIKDTYMEYMYKSGEYDPLTLDGAVEICSRLYLKFENAGINIIRIGLQPTENINIGGDVIAGPFHPAFRELVESKLLNEMIIYMAQNIKTREAIVSVNSRVLSKLYACSKKYFKSMLETLKPLRLKVCVNEGIPDYGVSVTSSEYSHIMSIKDYSYIL